MHIAKTRLDGVIIIEAEYMVFHYTILSSFVYIWNFHNKKLLLKNLASMQAPFSFHILFLCKMNTLNMNIK